MTLVQLLESPAVGLLLDLERDSFRVEVTEADTIRVSPADKLDSDRLEAIRRDKSDLLALVRLCDDGVQERLIAYRTQLADALPPRVPAFLFRDGVLAATRVCCSCGDALPPPERRTVTCTRTDWSSIQVELRERYGRCWRCLFAFRVAVGADLPVAVANARDREAVESAASTTSGTPPAARQSLLALLPSGRSNGGGDDD